MISNFFLSIIFGASLLFMIPFFCVFVQTIRNLIAFAVLIFLISINLILFYKIEFFPIFFMLIYIGAIVVITLFMVLTFDLRAEYSSKKIYDARALTNSSVYFVCIPVIATLTALCNGGLWKEGLLEEEDRLAIYHKCLNSPHHSIDFCDKHFGKSGADRGLYNTLFEESNDIVVLANNLYTTYNLLFILLGIVLTMALLAALTLLKGKK